MLRVDIRIRANFAIRSQLGCVMPAAFSPRRARANFPVFLPRIFL
jgi:hypothetical protein